MLCRSDITTCAKLVYYITNFIMALGGLTLMGFGIAVIVEITDFMVIIPYNLKLIPSMSIAFGILAFCSAVVGVFGAIKETIWVLIGNIIFMFGLAAVKIWMTLVIFLNMDNIYMMMRIMLDTAALNPSSSGSLFFMEIGFSCCGSTGADSYYLFDLPVPPTCCPYPVNGVCQPNMSYLGCSRVVGDFFDTFAVIIGNTVVRVAVVEVVTAVSAIFLIVFIRIKSREKL